VQYSPIWIAVHIKHKQDRFFKIKRQIGQDDWLYLTINEEFIEIQIDSKYEIDFGIVNHLILKEIFNIPDI
jgi:hypothetical protein